ncbi:MAG: TetR/AcrR family transcriptional regulator [Sphingomonadales bacterium]|nr:MAG: TetR/AcrR family transcriptional regulator [Sphingomonadales bacterium]
MNMMDTRALKRATLTEALADVVLAEGLDALSLRPAAARLGTSDRMLLYYYGTKAVLVEDVLACLAERFSTYLASTTKGARMPPQNMVGHTAAAMATTVGRPYVQLWLEIAARAGRGDPAYTAIAVTIGEFWTDWIVRSVHFPAGVTPRNAAAMMLAIVNGITLLDMSTPSVAEAARSRVQTS